MIKSDITHRDAAEVTVTGRVREIISHKDALVSIYNIYILYYTIIYNIYQYKKKYRDAHLTGPSAREREGKV